MKKIMKIDEYTLVQYDETDFEVSRDAYQDIEIYMSTYKGDIEVEIQTTSVGALGVDEYIKYAENMVRVAKIAKKFEEYVTANIKQNA